MWQNFINLSGGMTAYRHSRDEHELRPVNAWVEVVKLM